jgi:hypothetical protein
MVKVVLERSTARLVTLVIINYLVVSEPAKKGDGVITMGTVFCVFVTAQLTV